MHPCILIVLSDFQKHKAILLCSVQTDMPKTAEALLRRFEGLRSATELLGCGCIR